MMKQTKMLLILLVSSLMGCNVFVSGTNTGNPDLTSSPVFSRDGIFKLVNTVCVKINSCNGTAVVNECVNQVSALTGYTSELGATGSTYATVSDLSSAESASLVTINQTNFDNCETALKNLTCGDSLVQNGYSSGAPTDYSSTNILFRASGACTQIY